MSSAWFIGAHPDDAELFAAGTLLQLRANGWDIGWIIATDGAASEGTPDAALARRRANEAWAAAHVCGAEILLLGLPDGELAQTQRADVEIASAVARLKADILITHHPGDYHPDHRCVSRSVLAAAQPGQALLYAEPILGMGPLPHLWVDISATFEKKCEALQQHASQSPDAMMNYVSTWNSFRALQTRKPLVTHAEGFCRAEDIAFQRSASRLLPSSMIALER